MACLRLHDLALHPATGEEMRARCPLCNDRRPRLYVNVQKGVFHCHHCGESGRVVGAGERADALVVSSQGSGLDVSMAERDPDRLHEVYAALLRNLPCSPEHMQGLLKRGFTPEEIEELEYGTLPVSPLVRGDAARKVVCEAAPPRAVPGFYRSRSGWCISGPAGMMIPCRDAQGRIRGIHVRVDHATTGKYRWLSSAGSVKRPRSDGARATAWPHWTRGTAETGKGLWITEGPIKADLASLRLGRRFIAVPGVNSYRRAVAEVAATAVAGVIIAYDSDARRNEHVAGAARGLRRALWRHTQIKCLGHAEWQPEFKGIDDLLAAGGVPRIVHLAFRKALAGTGRAEKEGNNVISGTNRFVLDGVLAGPVQVNAADNGQKWGVIPLKVAFGQRTEVFEVAVPASRLPVVEQAGLRTAQRLVVAGELRHGAKGNLGLVCTEVLLPLEAAGQAAPAARAGATRPPAAPAKPGAGGPAGGAAARAPRSPAGGQHRPEAPGPSRKAAAATAGAAGAGGAKAGGGSVKAAGDDPGGLEGGLEDHTGEDCPF